METINPPPRRCLALHHGIVHSGWRRKPVIVIQGLCICFAFFTRYGRKWPKLEILEKNQKI